MLNIIRADLFRLRKSRMFKISVLISTICAVGIAVVLYFAGEGKVTQDVITNFSLLVDSFLIYFLGAMLIGNHITNDFESKAIHDEIASGNGRIAIVGAKLISSSIMIAAITLPYALTAIIGFGMNIKFGNYVGIPSVFFSILSNTSGVAVTTSTVLNCILLCLVMILVYLARLSICIPFAFKTKKIIPVTIIGILCSFGFDFIYAMGKNVKGITRTIELLPYGVTNTLSLTASKADLGKAVLISILFLLIIFFNTHRLFGKQEIK